MGLFSKKTLVCAHCGKEYQTRFAMGVKLCDECLSKKTELDSQVKGYASYSSTYFESIEEIEEIIGHRAGILEKYRKNDGISRAELKNASDNYKKLTDAQAEDVLVRAANSLVHTTIGAAYTDNFFALTQWEGVVVDAADVFAVAYTTSKKFKMDGQEVIICALFTNDPYVPAFTMVYTGKLGFFDFKKSSQGRQAIKEQFEAICPNLTYPVQDLADLNSQIVFGKEVKGNIDKNDMRSRIGEIMLGWGISNEKNMESAACPATAELLDQYGYILDYEIDTILKMDKMFNKNFWNKHIKRLSK
ncbi:MAG: hypothetical protein IJZ53_11200 [Tyzzerella sp.]|nr:hypothetical protein [Tyzzerella sp.]